MNIIWWVEDERFSQFPSISLSFLSVQVMSATSRSVPRALHICGRRRSLCPLPSHHIVPRPCHQLGPTRVLAGAWIGTRLAECVQRARSDGSAPVGPRPSVVVRAARRRIHHFRGHHACHWIQAFGGSVFVGLRLCGAVGRLVMA